jgi:hypothetical protein
VHGLMADSAGGAWTFGGSILTFALPMILFIVVAGGLYLLYTKPELVPGHRAPALERPVSYTPVPGQPTAQPTMEPAIDPQAQATPAAETTETTAATETAQVDAAEPAETTAGEAAETEDTE